MNMYSKVKKIYDKVELVYNWAGLRIFKKLYLSWYWKERRVFKLGFCNNGIIPFVIRRYAQNMGIGSYIISNLSQIKYAISKGYVPVVDMLNYNGTVMDGDGIVNSWELYFEQPMISLDSAYKSKEYFLSSGVGQEDGPKDSIDFFSDMDQLVYWHNLYLKYCRFNDILSRYITNEYNILFSGKGRILGVLCRGTDYLRLKPKGHPIQPDICSVIKKANAIMDEYKCDFLYLATEDVDIDECFRKEFGERLIINKRIYKQYSDGYLANTENDRKNDKYYTNCEYLSSIYLLSRCNCIICGRTSGAVLAMLMNCNYEYTYFWNVGTY